MGQSAPNRSGRLPGSDVDVRDPVVGIDLTTRRLVAHDQLFNPAFRPQEGTTMDEDRRRELTEKRDSVGLTDDLGKFPGATFEPSNPPTKPRKGKRWIAGTVVAATLVGGGIALRAPLGSKQREDPGQGSTPTEGPQTPGQTPTRVETSTPPTAQETIPNVDVMSEGAVEKNIGKFFDTFSQGDMDNIGRQIPVSNLFERPEYTWRGPSIDTNISPLNHAEPNFWAFVAQKDQFVAYFGINLGVYQTPSGEYNIAMGLYPPKELAPGGKEKYVQFFQLNGALTYWLIHVPKSSDGVYAWAGADVAQSRIGEGTFIRQANQTVDKPIFLLSIVHYNKQQTINILFNTVEFGIQGKSDAQLDLFNRAEANGWIKTKKGGPLPEDAPQASLMGTLIGNPSIRY
jgi:hypothetical protein